MSSDLPLSRRSLMTTAAALAGTGLLADPTHADTDASTLTTPDDTIPPLEFYFPSGLLDADGQPLTDDDLVAVAAESSTEFKDARAFWQKTVYDKGYEEDGVWTPYPDDTDIPLVAVDDQTRDGTVVGMTSLLVHDGTSWAQGNAQFMLNLLDDTIRDLYDEPTVLFHEYDGYYSLDKFQRFHEYAADHGYSIVSDAAVAPATDQPNLVAALYARNPEALWLPVPNQLDDPSLKAIDDYLDRGGVVVLQDCSDVIAEEYNVTNGYLNGNIDDPTWFLDPYEGLLDNPPGYLTDLVEGPTDTLTDILEDPSGNVDALREDPTGYLTDLIEDSTDPVDVPELTGYDEGDKESGVDPTTNLNELAEYLDIAFRFNDGLAYDTTRNAGAGTGFRQVPRTANFNTDRFPALFEARDGIDPNDTFYHYKGQIDQVVDGDTFNIAFEGDQTLETRVLGLDTPEDGGGDEPFERPVEWEGLAYTSDSTPTIQELQFDTATRLLDADYQPLTDDDRVAVRSEPTAELTTDDATTVDDAGMPLVATGDATVGIGSRLVDDDANPPQRRASVPTYEFLQNIWDAYTGGDATILYDTGHGQPALDTYAGYLDVTTGDATDRTARYTVTATDSLADDLDDADAVWLTPPTDPLSFAERRRLRTFVDNGGSVVMHASADATDEAIDNLNTVAATLEAPFRLTAQQVIDNAFAGGEDGTDETKPRTKKLGNRSRHPYFLLRQIPPECNAAGCPDSTVPPYLVDWGGKATNFCRTRMESEDVVFELDPNSVIIGGLGRIYGYTYLESSYPGGEPYGKKAVRKGYARVYDAGSLRHDEYLEAELEARANRRGLWGAMDPAASPPIRNRPVEEVYLPQAASVRTAEGALDRDRAPVLAESSATQTGEPAVAYDSDRGIPLVGVDRETRTACVGSPLIAESYEIREDDYRSLPFVTDADPFRVNTADFENFVLLTNLIEALSAKESGSVLIDGGHEQFGGSIDRFGGNFTVSAEDARYYERFLEGVGINCEGINDIASHLEGETILEARALVITTPRRSFSEAEIEAVRSFQEAGGAVVFLGSGEAPAEARARLNEVMAGVGTDLRVGDGRVRDSEQNLGDAARLPTTGRLNRSVDQAGQLFSAVEPEAWTQPGSFDRELPELEVAGSMEIDGATRATTTPEVGPRPAYERYVGQEDQPVKVTTTIEDVNAAVPIVVDVSWNPSNGVFVNIDATRGDVRRVSKVYSNDGRDSDSRVWMEPVDPSAVTGDSTVTRTFYLTAEYAPPEGGIALPPGYVIDPAKAYGTNKNNAQIDELDKSFILAPQ